MGCWVGSGVGSKVVPTVNSGGRLVVGSSGAFPFSGSAREADVSFHPSVDILISFPPRNAVADIVLYPLQVPIKHLCLVVLWERQLSRFPQLQTY